jgi:hypothetical protein
MQERSVDRVEDRCRRICGETRDDCFINSRKQINCISDTIINKTTIMTISLGSILKSNDMDLMKKKAAFAMKSASELANWIKYLQMVPDLQALSSLVLDAEAEEKRTEIRYPVPEREKGRIRVVLPGGSEAGLIYFSQSGLGILSPEPLEKGSDLECRLTSDITGPQAEVFRAGVRYSAPSGDGHFCGMLISEVKGYGPFNFFDLVNQFLTDIELREL